MNIFLTYLMVTLIPNLGFFAGPVSVISMFACIILVIMYKVATTGEWEEDEIELVRGLRKIALIVYTITTLLWVSMPTKSEMAMIVVSSFAYNIEGVNKLPKNMVDFVNNYIESVSKDLVTMNKDKRR